MSGDVHRRHPARSVLAAALACALIWLGLGFPAGVDPALPIDHQGAGVVVAQPAPPQFAHRAIARMGHFRASLISTAQRYPSGVGPLRAVIVALLMLYGAGASGRRPLRRHSVRMHGTRAPPFGFVGSGTPLVRA